MPPLGRPPHHRGGARSRAGADTAGGRAKRGGLPLPIDPVPFSRRRPGTEINRALLGRVRGQSDQSGDRCRHRGRLRVRRDRHDAGPAPGLAGAGSARHVRRDRGAAIRRRPRQPHTNHLLHDRPQGALDGRRAAAASRQRPHRWPRPAREVDGARPRGRARLPRTPRGGHRGSYLHQHQRHRRRRPPRLAGRVVGPT